MVFMIIIPFLNGYFIGNINPTFSDKPRSILEMVAVDDIWLLNFEDSRYWMERWQGSRKVKMTPQAPPGILQGGALQLQVFFTHSNSFDKPTINLP